MAAIAYYLLERAIIRAQAPESILQKAVGRDWKGKLSPMLYVVAIVATRYRRYSVAVDRQGFEPVRKLLLSVRSDWAR